MDTNMPLHVLLIEDNPGDARLVVELFKEIRLFTYVLTIRETLKGGIDFLGVEPCDVILLDLNLPDSRGQETFDSIFSSFPDIPIILVSGLGDEELSLKLIQRGAQDYISKGEIVPRMIEKSITYSLERNKLHNSLLAELENKKTAEEALTESERKYRILVETAMSGIFISNLKGELLFANEAFFRILEFNSIEEINQTGIENTYQNQSDRTQFINKLKSDKRVRNQELSLITKSGRIKSGLFSAYLEGDRITGTVIDITELVMARQRAEHSDRLKTAFMNNISHEIRTPLNGILGFSSLLRQADLNAEEKERYYKIIDTSSSRLLNTFNNYMDISMIVSGNMEPKVTRIEPGQLLQSILEYFQPFCISKNLALQLRIPENSEHITLITDPEFLRKAVHHLVDNAIKFTRKGGISFGFKLKPGNVEIFVIDTGIGIGKEAQTIIFERFAQEEISDTSGYEGSGLGLSIAQGLIGLLGSSILVHSEKWKGSVFSFSLPCEIQPAEPFPAELVKKVAGSVEKPVILYAEDDESNFFFIEILLRKANIKIIPAANGREAVDACHDHPEISLVLMDMKMPVMDGHEATYEIKSFRADLPIIAVTAFAMTGDEKRAREAGCDDYLAKPVTKEILFQKLNNYGIKTS